MNKLKIEHGASKVHWVLLKTSIEEQLSTDIDALCQWSENDRKYIVNELLRFAIAQAEEFQKSKTGLPANTAHSIREAATVPAASKAVPTIATHPSKEGAIPCVVTVLPVIFCIRSWSIACYFLWA